MGEPLAEDVQSGQDASVVDEQHGHRVQNRIVDRAQGCRGRPAEGLGLHVQHLDAQFGRHGGLGEGEDL